MQHSTPAPAPAAPSPGNAAVRADAPRFSLGSLALPGLAALLFASTLLFLVAFEQGALAQIVTDAMSDSGGVLHEFFHDARHLLGVPCH